MMPVNDPMFGEGLIRPNGRKLNPMFLFRVKTAAESHSDWDPYTLLATIPKEQAFRLMDAGSCPLLKP